MIRVVLAFAVMVFGALLMGSLGLERGSVGFWAGFVLVLFAVSAVIPHYLYRGEPLLPKRRERD